MPDRGTAAATNRSERARKVMPETVILLGGALAVAAGMGLVSGVEWAASSGCFRSGMAWGGPVGEYLRSGALVFLGIGFTAASLSLLFGATNETTHRLASRMWWAGLLGLCAVAATYPLAGLIGCAAT